MERYFKDQGFIIAVKNVGENDQLLTFLGKKSGKIQVLAKGIRKILAKNKSGTQILDFGELFLAKTKKGTLLLEAHLIERHYSLFKERFKFLLVFYFVKIVDKLILEKGGQEVVNFLQNFIKEIESGGSIDKLKAIFISAVIWLELNSGVISPETSQSLLLKNNFQKELWPRFLRHLKDILELERITKKL